MSTAVVTYCWYEILQILFVLQARVIVNIVTDLPPEDFLRAKRFDEKDRIIISDDELQCVRVRESESLGQVQFVAVLMTCTVEPGVIVDADCIDDERISFPFANRISVPCRIILGIWRMITPIRINQPE